MSIDVHQTRSIESIVRSIDVDRCRSMFIRLDRSNRTRSDSIQTRSIESNSIGLDPDSIDRPRSNSIQTRSIDRDRTRSRLDRTRSTAIDRDRTRWSSMSRDPRIPARGFRCAREWVGKPTHLVARARAFVRARRARTRSSERRRRRERAFVRDRKSSASTVGGDDGDDDGAVTEGIITSR